MRFDADLTACAGLVQRADPDRFMAAMAAPVPARATLFALYAFNVEVARAPWVTNEPEIAAIRLQWWRDALGEIAGGGVVRRHEVVTPLARILAPHHAEVLDELIVARYWDINKEPFEGPVDFERYITQITGTLIQVSTQSLGRAERDVVGDFAYATGLANWLRAVPELRARGRVPLLDGSPDVVRGLAKDGLERLARARARRSDVSRAASAGLLVGWQAEKILRQVLRDPSRVDAGTLGQGEIGRRLSLMTRVVTGRW